MISKLLFFFFLFMNSFSNAQSIGKDTTSKDIQHFNDSTLVNAMDTLSLLLNQLKVFETLTNKSLDSISKSMVNLLSIKKSSASDDDFQKIFSREDTSVFYEFSNFTILNEPNRAKAVAFLYISDLAKFNSLSFPVFNTDTSVLNPKIRFIENTGIELSTDQKKYSDSILRTAKLNLAYLITIQKEFFKVVKQKRIENNDLLNLRTLYSKPIQQKYIDEMRSKLGL